MKTLGLTLLLATSITTFHVFAQSGAIVINEFDLNTAILRGKDNNGKSKESYFLQIENKKLKFPNPSISSISTNSSVVWHIWIGDKISCLQTSKEAKEFAAKLKSDPRPKNIVGQYYNISNDFVHLENCYTE